MYSYFPQLPLNKTDFDYRISRCLYCSIPGDSGRPPVDHQVIDHMVRDACVQAGLAVASYLSGCLERGDHEASSVRSQVILAREEEAEPSHLLPGFSEVLDNCERKRKLPFSPENDCSPSLPAGFAMLRASLAAVRKGDHPPTVSRARQYCPEVEGISPLLDLVSPLEDSVSSLDGPTLEQVHKVLAEWSSPLSTSACGSATVYEQFDAIGDLIDGRYIATEVDPTVERVGRVERVERPSVPSSDPSSAVERSPRILPNRPIPDQNYFDEYYSLLPSYRSASNVIGR
jgi:hypothetical protein